MEIDYYNLDLKHMSLKEIVALEKKFLVKEWGKELIDSDDSLKNYVRLAMKYWPEYFIIDKGRHKTKKGYNVHHIDFDRSNNKICNLVVLTTKEHKHIHELFDPTFIDKNQKISDVKKGKKQSKETIEKRRKHLIGKSHPCKKETAQKISTTLQGHEPWNKNKKCPNISEGMKGVYAGWHWYKDKETGKRVWWRENPITHEIEYKRKK